MIQTTIPTSSIPDTHSLEPYIWNEDPKNVIYVILSHGYNFSKVLKAFKVKAEAESYLIYFSRNSVDKAYIEEVILE